MKKKDPLLDSTTGTTVLSHYQTYSTTCPLKPSNFWLPGAANLSEHLDQEVARYRRAAFLDNTKKTYQTHLRSYITFCEQSSIVPVPALDVTVAKYAALLAPRLKPSIKQYLNITRRLHLECNLDSLYADSWYLKTCLLYTSPSPRDQLSSRMPSSA